MPIHCSDLVEIIMHLITKKISSQIIECIGPETIAKRNHEKLLKLIGKKDFSFHYR